MTETDEHGNVFHPPSRKEFVNVDMRGNVTEVSLGHARAELALRFLEFCRDTDVVHILKDQRLDTKEIRNNCWVIVSEYFRP